MSVSNPSNNAELAATQVLHALIAQGAFGTAPHLQAGRDLAARVSACFDDLYAHFKTVQGS